MTSDDRKNKETLNANSHDDRLEKVLLHEGYIKVGERADNFGMLNQQLVDFFPFLSNETLTAVTRKSKLDWQLV